MAMLKVKLTEEQKIMFKDYLPEMAVEIPDEAFDKLYDQALKDYEEQDNG